MPLRTLSHDMIRACIRAAINDLDSAQMLEREQTSMIISEKPYDEQIAKLYKRSEDLLRDVWGHLEDSTMEFTKPKDY